MLGMAGAAADYLLDRFLPQVYRRRAVVPAIAVVIVSVMGMATIASREVQESREGGAFHDAPEVAAILMEVLEQRDRVVVDSHPRWVLDYYMSPESRSDPVLRRDFQNAQRLFVVVYHPRPQDLEGVLSRAGVPTTEFSDPTLRWSQPETDVYTMQRTG